MSYDTDVVAATSGRGDEADWDKIIRLCDRIRESFGPSSMGSALAAVMRRIKHPTPNIQSQALTLLEACVSNCGKDFQLELTKSTFQTQAKELITARSIAPASIQRFKTLLVSWSREYRNDTQMSGFCRFVDQLVNEGSIMVQAQPGSSSSSYATPSMYSSISPPQHQRDQPRQEDDLQKAIRLSLEEAQSSQTTSMYPTFNGPSSTQQTSSTPKKFKVRAIYDFMAIEDNEISFKAGEILTIIDNSDEHWWKGETQLGVGLFPANFVSLDLDAPAYTEKKTIAAPVDDGNDSKKEINESQVDLLLDMLKTADITSNNDEEVKTLNGLEKECNSMKPIIEENIQHLNKSLDEMDGVSKKLQEAFVMYRKLLQEGPRLSQKAPPPSNEAVQPPPYESNGSYFVPPPPDITGAYLNSYTQPIGDYGHPHIPPPTQGNQMSYAPPTQGYAPPTQGYAPPTQGYAPPTQSSYVPLTQPTQGNQMSYAPPTQGIQQYSSSPQFSHSYLAPPTQSAPVTMETRNDNNQWLPRQLTPPTNNSFWGMGQHVTPPTYQQPLL